MLAVRSAKLFIWKQEMHMKPCRLGLMKGGEEEQTLWKRDGMKGSETAKKESEIDTETESARERQRCGYGWKELCSKARKGG